MNKVLSIRSLTLGLALLLLAVNLYAEEKTDGFAGIFRQSRMEAERENMTSMTAENAAEKGANLYELIQQLENMEVPPTPHRKNNAEPPKPDITISKPERPIEPTMTEAQRNEQILAQLLSNPKNARNPLLVADALYRAKRIDAAATFYKVALDQIQESEQVNPSEPWILFQYANCLRKKNPSKAMDLYQEVADQYPESFWTQAALTQVNLLEWLYANETQSVLEKYTGDPNSY